MNDSAVLLIDCPDRKGLVASIANFLLEHDANILHADQHQDAERGLFFMRVEWDLKGFKVALSDFEKKFSPIAKKFQMRWQVKNFQPTPRVVILVSRHDHCLVDLLYRHRSKEIACEIPLIISNHAEAAPLAQFFDVRYEHIAVDPQNKSQAEKKQIALLEAAKPDLIVLARYMQILSPGFVQKFPGRILNVHHSFLPAFSGAKPYLQAFERGVKLIGATSHYVTEVLDDGPIIEQDVLRISHRDQLSDLTQKGKDLEKMVLSRAVRWHLERRILVYGNKTVVFD
jgi:formyltetrahydrofolate deformylase